MGGGRERKGFVMDERGWGGVRDRSKGMDVEKEGFMTDERGFVTEKRDREGFVTNERGQRGVCVVSCPAPHV